MGQIGNAPLADQPPAAQDGHRIGIGGHLVYGYPCICKNGQYEIVQGLPVDAFSRGRMDATEKELREERAAIEELLK